MPPLDRSRRRLLQAAMTAAAAAAFPLSLRADDAPLTAGPYVPTPQAIVDRMLQVAKVGPHDFVVDLGSGDGRLVRTAAKVYGARGFGVDIDRELVQGSNAEALREGLQGRVSFFEQDVFRADIRKASVVTLYVLPDMMVALRPKMLTELRPGTRIVAHDYHFREWAPDGRWSFDVPEKREMVGFSSTTIYLWIVPAHVAGGWRMRVADDKLTGPLVLTFNQLFQHVSGIAQRGNESREIAHIKLHGDELEFVLDIAHSGTPVRHTFQGKVSDAVMSGEVLWGSVTLPRRAKWTAERTAPASEELAR
jgi:hypothetical protein